MFSVVALHRLWILAGHCTKHNSIVTMILVTSIVNTMLTILSMIKKIYDLSP